MDPIRIDDDRVLRPYAGSDLDELQALIEANHEHLAPWMPWAGQPREDTAGFLARAEERAGGNDGGQFAVIESGRIVGAAGFDAIDRSRRSTTIGYWLAADAQGRGTMTLAVAALLDLGFRTWGLQRVEVRVAAVNARSLAVVRRLGFVEEGVQLDAERVGDRHPELVVHAMLAHDWRARNR